jgi:hypothetical protein
MLLAALLATAVACNPPADTTGHLRPAGLANLRPRDGMAAQLLSLGREGSPTFRALERVLNESRVVVYVDVRDDPRHELGASLQFVVATPDRLFVRAVVDTGTKQFGLSQQRLVVLASLLGHELQHAAEVAAAPSIASVRDFEAHFRRIGISEERSALETAAAQEVGRRVKRELQDGKLATAPCGSVVTHTMQRPGGLVAAARD